MIASTSVRRSNFALVLFKTACCANPGKVRKQAGPSSYQVKSSSFQYTYFESS